MSDKKPSSTAKALSSSDLLTLKFISDPQLSPDGRTVAAVVTTIVTEQGRAEVKAEVKADEEKPPRYRSRIHLFTVPASSEESFERDDPGRTALTQNDLRDFRPRISPDGRSLAFLRLVAEDEPPQLYLLPLSQGGEAVKLTTHEAGVGEFVWHPDGGSLIYTSRGERTDEAAKRGLARRIRRLRYRGDGEGFLPSGAVDLYRLTLSSSAGSERPGGEKAGGERPGGEKVAGEGAGAAEPVLALQRLTTTTDEDAYGGPSALTLDPAGRFLYFQRANHESDFNDFRSDVMALDLGSLQSSVLLRSVLGAGDLAVSPSGRRLAYTAACRQDDLASGQGVWLLELDQEAQADGPRLLSGEVEVQPAEAGDSRHGQYPNRPTWQAGAAGTSSAAHGEAESLLVNTHLEGRSGLAHLHLDGRLEAFGLTGGEAGGGVDEAGGSGRAVTAFSAAPEPDLSAGHQGASVAFLAETPVNPGELWARLPDGRELRLSSLNDDWLENHYLHQPAGPFKLDAGDAAEVDTDTLAGHDAAGADQVEYWTLSPAQPRPDDAVVLQVHGGPHTAYGNGFVFEFQLLAARGYRVVYGNPRGSSSYGHHFATCLLGAYGSVDADDVMAIATQAVERLALQQAPLHLTGGSYGGFMTNWLLGVSDRFRSAVSQRSISNWTSMYGTSDIGPAFVEREICGVPWQDGELLWRQSPLRNVAAVNTPLLLIHSEEDYRCPIEQAEQFFSALKRLGRSEVELLRFPGEGHELSRSGRPDRRIQRLDAIVDWFERHT